MACSNERFKTFSTQYKSMIGSNKLQEKYVSEAEKIQPGNEKKIVLTNETYAICEFLEDLRNQISRSRN